jgi:sugar phosphate isomerase/epimerase
MEIGLDTYSIRFQNFSILDKINYANDHGFRKISIDIEDIVTFSNLDEIVKGIKKVCSDNKIRLSIAFPPMLPRKHIHNSLSIDNDYIILLKKYLSLSKKLDAEYIRMYILESGSCNVKISKNIIKHSHKIFNAIYKDIKNLHLFVIIENHQDLYSSELIEFVKEYEEDFVGICFDFGNQIALGENPESALDNVLERVKVFHLKDIAIKKTTNGYIWRSVPLGRGCLPLLALLRKVLNCQGFFEISTSRSPSEVIFSKIKARQEFNAKINCLLKSGYIWNEEIENYLCRDIHSKKLISEQEIAHLDESIEWFKNNIHRLS